MRKTQGKPPSFDSELYLLAGSGLGEFITFVQKRAIDGKSIDEMQLADAWRKANRLFNELADKEKNICDNPEVLPISKDLQSHLNQLSKQESFAASFSNVPICFGMVELEKLIVSQYHITTSTVGSLSSHLGDLPSNQELIKTCLPLGATKAKFDVMREDKEGYIFQSDSHDLRFLGARLLDPKVSLKMDIHGHPAAILALAVGYSSNALNVVRYKNRMVLNNGYHRAYTLRALGVTHAPCVIQVCGHIEEVAMAGSSEILDNRDIYFDSPRPPMLKDYFNKKLIAKYKTYRELKQVQLKYFAESYKVKYE